LQLSTFQQQKFGVDAVYKLFPEYIILKVNDFNRWSKVPLEQWAYFLANTEIPEDANAPSLQEAREKLLFAKMSRDEQIAYRRYIDDRVILADQIVTARGEGRLEGHAEGHAQGLAEGERKGHFSVARNLEAMGLSDEDIVRATGLSPEEVEQL